MFITFEGIDGCGKTTQVNLLAAELVQSGYSCLKTYQPGASSLGKTVRSCLLEAEENPCALAEALLFMADRCQHVHELIKPALGTGRIVLCDRYTDSTLAYQGYGSGQDTAVLRKLNDIATAGLTPDLTFFFDLAYAHARTRRKGAELSDDRFEREDPRFHERVREGYLALAKAEPARFVIIDADHEREEICAEIKRVTLERLGGFNNV